MTGWTVSSASLHPDEAWLLHYHFTRQKQTATYAQNHPLVLDSKIFIKKALLSHELAAICQQKMSPVKDILIHQFQNSIWYSCLPSILTQIHSCGVRSCSAQNKRQLLSCPLFFVWVWHTSMCVPVWVFNGCTGVHFHVTNNEIKLKRIITFLLGWQIHIYSTMQAARKAYGHCTNMHPVRPRHDQSNPNPWTGLYLKGSALAHIYLNQE